MKFMELAGNSQDPLEQGQLRIVKTKVEVFIAKDMEMIEMDGHVVQEVDFVTIGDDYYDKLAWRVICPLCDVEVVDRSIWSRLDQGLRDLAKAEKAKFDNASVYGTKAASQAAKTSDFILS